MTEGLGPARSYGIYEAEYRGLQLGLSLALREASVLTRIVTIILDNQSVIKDLKSHKQTLTSLLDKQRTYTVLMYLERAFPGLRVIICWCPGHAGVRGNEIVDKLAQSTAKKSLSDTSRRPPGIAAFQGAIKEWVRLTTSKLTTSQTTRLGHEHQSAKHMKALKKLTKPSISAITQLRSNHAPLNNYLFNYQQRADPVCKCDTGVETADHFLFICPRFDTQRETLTKHLKRLKIPALKACLANPKAYPAIADFCNATWRLKDRWDWARILEEETPNDTPPP